MWFISKKKRSKINPNIREASNQIIEIFEEKLEELDITLPDKDRSLNVDEARIYGTNYYDLEDRISEFLNTNKKQLLKYVN